MIRSSQNIELYTKDYPVKNPKANLLIVHGLHEHCERYQQVADSLNEIGVSVFTFDLRGHGQSGGPRHIIQDMDEYRQDVENVYRSIPKNIPFFILGHSMGGLIAVNFLLYQERTDVNGVILSGAALEVGKDITPTTVKIVRFIGKYFPGLKTSKLNPKSISRDPEAVESYVSDPLITKDGAKAGLGLALINSINQTKTILSQFNFPVLIMHGGADKITNPEGSKALFALASSSDKTLKIWDGAYHEIFHETNKEEIIAFMTSWVSERL
ncbi:MAG: lysophospholipase [Saprospiraceae bacterium]